MTQATEPLKPPPWFVITVLALLTGLVLSALALAWLEWADSAFLSSIAPIKQLLTGVACWLVLTLFLWTRPSVRAVIYRWVMNTRTGAKPARSATLNERWPDHLRVHLHTLHGPFWRRQVRLLLVVGEPEQVEAIAPGLAKQHWLHLEQTLLIWGGSVQSPLDADFYAGISRWRPLDGVVWALTAAQSADATAMDAGARHLQGLARDLRWQLPLHLWQVCDSPVPMPDCPLPMVGCVLGPRSTPEQVSAALSALVQPVRQQGMAQLRENMRHDYLLRLSRDLHEEGVARWRQALTPMLGRAGRGLAVRGLWFSLALPATNAGLDHQGPISSAWQGVVGDKPGRARRVGWPVSRVAQVGLLSLALLCTVGLLLSYTSNRAQISQVETVLADLQRAQTPDEHLQALNQSMYALWRLADRGPLWHQRLGLNRNEQLQSILWPRYVHANNHLLRDPAAGWLQDQLLALVVLPVDSPERARRAPEAYEQLKAYLMMARPEKADPVFLAKVLGGAEPLQGDTSPGLWQVQSPGLWQFYAEQLPAHPHWRIEINTRLVAQARQVLLGQLGQRNAQTSLYQQVLEGAANHYPALGLHALVGDTDAGALFSTRKEVPGIFTRQAWEGQVRRAIEEIAEARREQIDWVLSDSPADIAAELTPQALAEQLTARYFQDYADAWVGFMSSLRWQKASSLAQVIDQLTLMSDTRQSPLLALAHSVAWHGQAGTGRQALSDTLIQSAQQLIGQNKAALAEPWLNDNARASEATPLDATFGPWRTLLGKDLEGRAADSERLSLQAFLTRVTRVRLKLQQISHASDPQGMTQALAQTVFQGRSVDLTDTRVYGSLIAASLGAEWGAVGQTLFVEPLEQAWRQVLQPSAASLNSQWQRAIVTPWEQAFNGRYPFAATGSDASLALLGQMVRADSGRIEQFVQRELSGVLRKEGNRWVVDPTHAQGLRVNPQLLDALNQLSHLADVLFTDGGLGMGFELQGKPVSNVVQTTFILNGVQHEYFNQRERWQRFTWPGQGDHPGARLLWTAAGGGPRMYGDYQGTWGLIRLLEQAQITALDDGDSRYKVVLKAPDGLNLTWQVRTEVGAGPMTLLKLRRFALPRQVFLVADERGNAAPKALADNGRFE